MCLTCKKVFDDLGSHVKRAHPDDSSDLVRRGTEITSKLFYQPLKEFDLKKSETLESYESAERSLPIMRDCQRKSIAQRSKGTPDIPIGETILKYAQKLDENGEYCPYIETKCSKIRVRQLRIHFPFSEVTLQPNGVCIQWI